MVVWASAPVGNARAHRAWEATLARTSQTAVPHRQAVKKNYLKCARGEGRRRARPREHQGDAGGSESSVQSRYRPSRSTTDHGRATSSAPARIGEDHRDELSCRTRKYKACESPKTFTAMRSGSLAPVRHDLGEGGHPRLHPPENPECVRADRETEFETRKDTTASIGDLAPSAVDGRGYDPSRV